MDDVHDLFKEKLSEVLEPVEHSTGLGGTRPEFRGIYKVAPEIIEFGEDPLDALARHLCIAMTEPEEK